MRHPNFSYHRSYEVPSNFSKAVNVGSRIAIQTRNIVLISAETSYSRIHLLDGKSVLVSTNIQKLQERFLAFGDMVRVHRSHMINVNYIQEFNKNTVMLKNNLRCPISRRKKINFKNALNN